MATRWWTRLSVRLSIGVAALYAVLTVAVLVAIAALFASYRALQEVGSLTAAEREAAAIGVAAREQYIHETHAILTADPVHLGHDKQWAAELEKRVAALRPMVGPEERRLLDEVEKKSYEMSHTFAHEIFPAVQAGDLELVRKGHQRVQALLDAMIEASDRAAAHLALVSVDAVAAALRRARIAGGVALGTTALAALAAVALAVSFVRRIVRPVASLNAGAARIGRGEFDAVVEPTGAAEFEELRSGLETMAARLREREARLLKAERLAGVGALSAGIAHELNNPLGVILGYLKTMRATEPPEEMADDLRILEEEANQCRRIVEDLLTFAREPTLERSPLDVVELVRSEVARLSKSGELRGRTVTVHPGRGGEGLRASIDGARLAQVLRNLVLNSVAASPIDGVIRVEIEGDRGQAVLRVVDEGSGISPKDMPHLFEPFFTRRAGGTGLGLAVSHGIVRAHGGSIDVQSLEGEGTRVEVRVPMRKDEAA